MVIKIDALYFLLIVELAAVFFAVSAYLFVKNRKYRAVIRKASKADESSMPAQIERETETAAQRETAVEDASIQEEPAAIQDADIVISEGGEVPANVGKLRQIVKFQKSKILELMCYKDIFEGAQKKLTGIKGGNDVLQDRFVKLLGESIENKGLADALESFGKNNNELQSCITVLEKENETLNEKFARWEEELKRIWAEAEAAGGIEEGLQGGQYGEKLNEILKEREELMAKLKEFEGTLKEKDDQLADMQKQYEDIEKEYMVLYNQQQSEQQKQQAE
jgi:flagellar capping protein FliD